MNTLTINVQVDRLPDIEADDGSGQVVPCAMVTLKVSAMVEGTGPLPEGAADELLPWKWHKESEPQVPWDAHDPDAWEFWTVDPEGHVQNLQRPDVRFFGAVTVPDTFDRDTNADLNERFDRRLAAEIADIVAGAGDAALRRPDPDAPTTGRTLFGLVESLSGLPFPVAAKYMAVTAIRFTPPPDPAHLVLAAPRFASANRIAYALDMTSLRVETDIRKDGASVDCAVASGATFETPRIRMLPGQPANELPAEENGQRLLDLEQMIVRVPTGHSGVEASDWAAALPRRIAETIDPYARLLAVFDDTISQALADEDATPRPLRRALAADLKPGPSGSPPPRRLLRALDHVAWSVVGPRMTGSDAAPPPAPILLQAIAERSPLLADAVAERLLAAAAMGDAAGPGDRSTHFAAFPAERLARLAGLPPDDLPAEVAASDRPEGFMAALLRRWTDLDAASVRLRQDVPHPLGAQRAAISKAKPAWPKPGPGLARVGEPLFDGTRLRSMAWHVAFAADGAFGLDIGLAPGAPDCVASVTGTPSAAGKIDVALTLPGVAEPARLSVGMGEEVLLTLALAAGTDGEGAPSRDRDLRAGLSSGANTAVVTGDGRLLRRSAFSFVFTARQTGLTLRIPISRAATALVDELRRVTTAQALRGDLALAYAGPYIEGIVAGRVVWNGVEPAEQGSLENRIAAAIRALVAIDPPGSSLYARLLDAALAHAGLPARGAADDEDGVRLRDLVVRLMTDAAAGAAVLAGGLVPATRDGMASDGMADQARRLTVEATPLVVRIDQIETFDTNEDL